MNAVLKAKVASPGTPYADGTPNLEINLPVKHAVGLTFVTSKAVAIKLRVAGHDYNATVLRNRPEHSKVWFSPKLIGSRGERLTLGRVLTDAGFKANDSIQLAITNAIIEVQAMGAIRIA